MVTYEGHAWERIMFSNARKVKPEIKCIGYQHSRIFRMQHSLHRSLGKDFDPDIILTSGTIGKNYLRSFKNLNSTKIIVIGSDRFNHFKKFKKVIKCNLNKNTCLVIPEGLISECLSLFKFSLIYASKYPDFNFIWRLHPEMSFKELRLYSNIFDKIPNNITISNKAIEEDVEKSNFALYRGSTAIFIAILRGLSPIYLKLKNEINIDPLYYINDKSHIIQTIEHMNKLINKDLNLKEIDKENSKLIKIQKTLLEVFSPMKSDKLINHLKKNNDEN